MSSHPDNYDKNQIIIDLLNEELLQTKKERDQARFELQQIKQALRIMEAIRGD